MVHRSARIELRLTRAQARRCYRLLRVGGDIWAALIELNQYLFRGGARPLFSYQELCRELAGTPTGEVCSDAARSVARRYSDACFEAARRKRAGGRARYPRRRRALFPLRWYAATFEVADRRLRLAVAKGAPPLWLRLSRPVPYPLETLRAVTLGAEAGRLYVDVTAELAVEDHDLDPERVAGVDLGIIHPTPSPAPTGRAWSSPGAS